MGRAPCCDKANVKKGPWSPEEDAKLKSYIDENGTGGNWIALPQKIGIKRCGKSCRLRWLNYLRPNIKHGGFSEEEDNIICSLYISIGSRWSIIAAQLPGRTDNDIKNYWNTRLKKKLLGKQRKEQHHARRGTAGSSSSQKQLDGQMMIKKGREKSISTVLSSDIDSNVQTPYWPELPPVMPRAVVPYPYSINNYEPPSFNDHNSIRKLLIKLGGRFSCDDSINNQSIGSGMILNPSQFPIEVSSTVNDQAPPHHDEPSINTNISASSLSNSQYSMDGEAIINPVPILGAGESTGNIFTADQLVEMVYNANVNLNPQRLHGNGMEFLYEDLVSIYRSTIGITTRVDDQSMDWGEMSSIFCPNPAVSCSYYHEALQQGIVQECGYTELNNPGAK